MNINRAIEEVSKKFQYQADNNPAFVDYWRLMDEDTEGKLRGDCEDYALTVLWYICDKSWLKFLWNVVITFKYRIYHVTTHTGGRHAVGCVDGFWFDNWTKKALAKHEFLKATKHEIKYLMPMPLMIIPFMAGYYTRLTK